MCAIAFAVFEKRLCQFPQLAARLEILQAAHRQHHVLFDLRADSLIFHDLEIAFFGIFVLFFADKHNAKIIALLYGLRNSKFKEIYKKFGTTLFRLALFSKIYPIDFARFQRIVNKKSGLNCQTQEMANQ